MAWPLVLLFVATALSLWVNVARCVVMAWSPEALPAVSSVHGMGLGWVWSAYNLFTLAVVLLILLDVPRPSDRDWFDLQRSMQVDVGDRSPRRQRSIPSRAGEVRYSISTVLVAIAIQTVPAEGLAPRMSLVGGTGMGSLQSLGSV